MSAASSDRAAVHDLLTTFTSYYASGAYQDHLEWEFRFSSFRTFNAQYHYDYALLYDEYASAGAYLQKFGWKIQGPAQRLRRWSLNSPLVTTAENQPLQGTRSRITEYMDGPMIGRLSLEHKSPYLVSKTKSMHELNELYHVRVSMQQEKVESGLTQQDLRAKRDSASHEDAGGTLRELVRTSFVHPDFPSIRIDCSDVTFFNKQRGGAAGKRGFEIEMEILPQSVRALTAAKIVDAIRQIVMGLQFSHFGIMSGRKWKKVAAAFNEILGFSQMRFPQPVSISPNHLPMIIRGEFAVTEKADGRRSLLYLCAAEENKRELFRVDFYGRFISTGLFLPSDMHASVSSFLLDAEYIQESQLFLVFDIYMFEGIADWGDNDKPSEQQRTRFHSKTLPERYRALQSVLARCANSWTGKGKEHVQLRLKNMVFPSGQLPSDNRALFEFIHGVQSKTLPFPGYQNEGLLFTSVRAPLPVHNSSSSSSFVLPIASTLSACRWSGAVKFKEPQDTTNDFQLGRFQFDDVHHTLFAPLLAYSSSTSQLVLFAGVLPADSTGEKHSYLRLDDQRSITRRDVASSSFMVELGALQLYEGCIVECCFDRERRRWVPLRNRPDKRFPNSVDVVYANWELIHSPVRLPTSVEEAEAILKRDDSEEATAVDAPETYYKGAGSRDQSTAALREFHNYVKRYALKRVLRKYSATAAAGQKILLLDLAIGRGGDLHKYFAESAQIGRIIGVDISLPNLELCQRRYAQMCISSDTSQQPAMDLLHGSSALSFQDTKNWQVPEKLPQQHTCDIAVLHFALHYFWQTARELEGLLANLDFCVPVGGFFLATCFDGTKVYDFFSRNDALTLQDKASGEMYMQIRPGKDWRARPARPWSALDSSDDSVFGMELQVFVRSIHEDKYFTEWLVHPKRLVEDMAKVGFRLIRLCDLLEEEARANGLDESFLDFYLKHSHQRARIPEDQLSTVEAWNRLFVFERVSYRPIGAAFPMSSSSTFEGEHRKNVLHRYVQLARDGDRRVKFANSVQLHPSTYFGLTVPLDEAKKRLFG